MPYYLYRMRPFAPPEAIGTYSSFRDASVQAKAVRAAAPGEPPRRVRVVFAENALAAEDLLQQVREAPPGGDDD